MKKQTIVILALTFFILLGLQLNSVASASQIYYSDKLTVGNEFVWDLTYYEFNMEIEELFMDLENESVITLEILQSPADVNFAQIAFSNFSDYFNLTFGEQIYDFHWDDPFHWFIYPISMDGVNSVEEGWIYAVIDDFYFNEDSNFTIEIKNNQVRYVGDIKYGDDTTVDVELIIEQDTGIMIHISVTFGTITSEETNYQIVFKRRGVDNSFSVPMSLFAFIIPLVLITVILRKRNRYCS